jgi:hypothetical protein
MAWFRSVNAEIIRKSVCSDMKIVQHDLKILGDVTKHLSSILSEPGVRNAMTVVDYLLESVYYEAKNAVLRCRLSMLLSEKRHSLLDYYWTGIFLIQFNCSKIARLSNECHPFCEHSPSLQGTENITRRITEKKDTVKRRSICVVY